MSDLSYTVTIDGDVWSEAQLRRVEYERTLHVLHELKALGVPLKDGDRELSHTDLNWLEPAKAEQISLDARDALGEDGFLEVYKNVLADSDRRWKEFSRDYDPAAMHIGTTFIEAHGIGIQETLAIIGGAATQRDALAANPEHYVIVGDIQTGQRGSETFGMFGEPVYVHGATEDLPADSPVAGERDESYPMTIFGQFLLKSDDTPIHTGALHQIRPTEDGFAIKSTFNCPGKAPKAIADGHKLHFALEIINSMKIAHAHRQVG